VTSRTEKRSSPCTTAKIDEDVGSEGVVFHVHAVERKNELAPGSGLYGNPMRDHIFLVIDVSIQNNRPKDYEYHIMHAIVKDAEGLRHNTSSAIVGLTELKVFSPRSYIGYLPLSITLKPGERMSGFMPVEVPADSTGFVLTYNDRLENVRVDIALGL